MAHKLIEIARLKAQMTQTELAELAATSRPTLSAYEAGKKSPTLTTVERILKVAGFVLSVEPDIVFSSVEPMRGRPFFVPNKLWRLPVDEAFQTVELPLALNWSQPGRRFRLSDRIERARCYEILLREGQPHDLMRVIDGALLVDLWSELVIPRQIRREWDSVISGISP